MSFTHGLREVMREGPVMHRNAVLAVLDTDPVEETSKVGRSPRMESKKANDVASPAVSARGAEPRLQKAGV